MYGNACSSSKAFLVGFPRAFCLIPQIAEDREKEKQLDERTLSRRRRGGVFVRLYAEYWQLQELAAIAVARGRYYKPIAVFASWAYLV
jgi:hypothetical protein